MRLTTVAAFPSQDPQGLGPSRTQSAREAERPGRCVTDRISQPWHYFLFQDFPACRQRFVHDFLTGEPSSLASGRHPEAGSATSDPSRRYSGTSDARDSQDV